MLNFFRGDTKKIKVEVIVNSVPLSLTNAVVLLSMKRDLTDTKFALQKEGVLGENENESIITLTPAETKQLYGRYYYDIELTKASGEVVTLDYGKVKVIEDVSNL